MKIAKESPPSAIRVGETDPMAAISSRKILMFARSKSGSWRRYAHHLSRYPLLEVLDYVGEVTSPESSFVKRVPQLVILSLWIVWMEIAERPLNRPGDDGVEAGARIEAGPAHTAEREHRVCHVTGRRMASIFTSPFQPLIS